MRRHQAGLSGRSGGSSKSDSKWSLYSMLFSEVISVPYTKSLGMKVFFYHHIFATGALHCSGNPSSGSCTAFVTAAMISSSSSSSSTIRLRFRLALCFPFKNNAGSRSACRASRAAFAAFCALFLAFLASFSAILRARSSRAFLRSS